MSDLISRQDAIDAIDRAVELSKYEWEHIEHEFESLPSAEQTGEWIYLCGPIGSYMTISCPFCGVTFNNVAELEYNFCPNCGADMGGKKSDV